MKIVTGAPQNTTALTELGRMQHLIASVPSALNADFTKPFAGTPVNGGWANTGLAAQWALADGRQCKKLYPTLAQGQESIFTGLGANLEADFNFDLSAAGAGLVEALAGAVQPRASVFQAWLRLVDASVVSARQFFGFRNSFQGVLGSTKVASRVGLFGNGVSGFRFGSLNCPDGAPGTNGFADADAGAVNPPLLVNPGLKWFSVKIKLIPGTAVQPGRCGCYLDGVLLATFSTVANLPRGTNGTNRQYTAIVPSIFADFDAVTQLNGFLVHRPEFWYDADLTL